MNMSFNRPAGTMPRIPTPVTAFQYRDSSPGPMPQFSRLRAPEPAPEPPRPRAEVEMTRAELQAALAQARTEGASAAEARLREDAEKHRKQEAARITAALDCFDRERKGYFARIESEVVRLSLSIAAKILHREAQVDPMLVAALVQIAVNQLKENTAVSIRVHPGAAARWRAHFEATPQWAAVSVVEDSELDAGDCMLETALGSANFSLAAQLKEVEQGFFDILAQTPRT